MDVLQLQTEAKEELLDVQENNEYNLHFEPSKVVHFKNPELSLAERDTLKLHPCDVCQKLCLGTSLSRHRRKEHPEVKPLQCYYCTFQCASPSGLSRHRRKFHYERKGFELYKCLPCGIIYEPISAYNQHMTEFHSVPSSSLTSFNTTSSRRIVHPLSQPKNCFYFRCPYCDDRDCKNEKGLKNHMSRFHSSQPRILYQCKSCPYKTNRRAEFCGHMRCHTRKSNFDCTHCTASFSTADMLEIHSKSMHPVQYVQRTLAQRHKESKMGQREEKSKSPANSNVEKIDRTSTILEPPELVLHFNLQIASGVESHAFEEDEPRSQGMELSNGTTDIKIPLEMSDEEGDKGETNFAEIDPLSNDESGQKQAVESGAITLPIFHKLHRKMKVLNRGKGTCQTCGEEMLLVDLLLHIRSHITADQLHCHLCHHIYASNETLLDHMHTHYGLEPHKCAICKKTYSLKQSTLNHIFRTHRQIRPMEYYICMIPGYKKAATKSCQHRIRSIPNATATYTVSQNETTKIKTFRCNYCQVTLSSKFSMQRHEVKVHGSVAAHLNQKNGTEKRIFRCSFCLITLSSKFSVQRHEEKMHSYIEVDPHREYRSIDGTHADSLLVMDSGSSEVDGGTSGSWSADNYAGVTFADELKWYKCSSCLVLINEPQHFLHHIATHPKNRRNENVLAESLIEFLPPVCSLEKITEKQEFLEQEYLKDTESGELFGSSVDANVTTDISALPPELEEENLEVVSCLVCSKSVPKAALLRHIRDMHKYLEPSSCDICGRTFSGKYFLQQHVLHEHSGNPPPFSSVPVCIQNRMSDGNVLTLVPVLLPALNDDLPQFQQIKDGAQVNSNAVEGPDCTLMESEIEQYPQIILGI